MRRRTVIELKTRGEIDAMRRAGRVVARCLDAVRGVSVPGVTLKELDTVAHDVMRASDATPAFLDYHPHFAPVPFPGVICASVNDAVVHAIPGTHRLVEGDLVSIDCGAFVDGWCGDAAVSYVVGAADPDDLALIETTERALAAGVAAARPGARHDADGWTLRTADGSRAAHAEHTVAITADGPRVLTRA